MMLFNGNRKKSVFDKINEFLVSRGHELVLSIYLSNYNGNNIYIRFDYVNKLSVYKVVWIDLNFFDEKHLEDYINMSLVTKFLSIKIVEELLEIDYENSYNFDENIIGDRVEILSYVKEEPREYIFDRFLPRNWNKLIQPIVLIFSYLPRSMDVFLNEMFAIFDGKVEKYNCSKPIKFDLLKGSSARVFRPMSIKNGTDYYDEKKVKFLEKVDDEYMALVEGNLPYLVIMKQVDDEHSIMLCNCRANYYCRHIYAALLALRRSEFNNFYKVKYIKKDKSLLEQVTEGDYYISFGIRNDKMMIVTPEGGFFEAEIVQNGKCVFEVIEDDDDCTLSKQLEKYKNSK